MNYKTPGVYVEEVSLLPPSVAQVETAIPAFIGYTEKAADEDGNSLLKVPTRVKSLLEYEAYFGKSHQQPILVTLADQPPFQPQSVDFNGGEVPYRMYQALQMYFANGGGPCYIISTGDFDSTTPTPSLDAIDDYTELKEGLDAARKIDEITLILFPEADRLSINQYYDIYKDVLSQCADLKDRFGLFDVLPSDTDASGFRDNIGVNNLSYGAAYYPYLDTKIVHPHSDSTVTLSHGATDAFNGQTLAALGTVAEALAHQAQVVAAKAVADQAVIDAGPLPKTGKLEQYRIALGAAQKAHKNGEDALLLVTDDTFTSAELTAAKATLDDVIGRNISSSTNNTDIETAIADLAASCADSETAAGNILAQVNTDQGIPAARNTNIATYFTNAFLAEVNTALSEFTVAMPPSSAVVGIYARTDNTRGVWKAPANVSINLINGPTVKVDNTDNDNFNVHPTGKSINVIRSFTGKGTLVWGARTLDGNSNEWRYISVRRFFNMVEESVKKASEQFVFENNDANTWVKVKAMIENFLILQWRAGALMGGKPEEAFFVKVGLGETMIQDDVLNGRMIVEIGMAVVRPAEFIILRFSHKMMEA
ncbi:phage tail sheath family protein [Poritiphilus flavus]|uniref:Phage tail protein n=1 Tax=Poritiphilus flavus TaxID=2697053 RepID=A0A6L9EJF2_9FLAO|nr:phage tail sheath C-terminal domain-containing protein [Poritiphilus flavus]NAS14309.1 phage tail protein [Poritiphilus flavus]